MKNFLELEPAFYAALQQHLFPQDGETEEAAFLCITPKVAGDDTVFEVVDSYFAQPQDFAAREGDYLELTDETRAGLIQLAHGHGASLVEIHSHLGPYPAAFSPSDRAGLRETVPHMRWRLKNRPYLALVFARSGFDALLWRDNPHDALPLDGLLVGDRKLQPTRLSLRRWYERE